jgi:hypothetical protein
MMDKSEEEKKASADWRRIHNHKEDMSYIYAAAAMEAMKKRGFCLYGRDAEQFEHDLRLMIEREI